MQPSPTHLELGPVTAGDLPPPRRPRRGRTVAAADLRSHSRLLLFDDELKSAARTLAGDLDRMAALEPTVEAGDRSAAATGKLLVIAGAVNAHARTAQQACGLPGAGVFGG